MSGGRLDQIDVAVAVNSMVMNGGLDHAFHTVGDTFPAAIVGFTAAGRDDIADLLARFAALVAPSGIPSGAEDREQLIDALTAARESEMQGLIEAYDAAPDPQADLEGHGS